MIRENIEIVYNTRKFVTRICDGCGREDKLKMSSVFYSRKYRNRKLDLCSSCSSKNDFLDKPRKKGYVGRPQPKNEDSPLWKGGIDKSTGYKKINDGEGKTVFEHRLIVSKSIDRDLKTDEVVHHIDLNKLNNNIDNLYLYNSKSDHLVAHDSLEKCGIQFLNSKIWFSFCEKKYKLYDVKNEFADVDISDLENEKIYYKTDPRSKLTYAFIYIRFGQNDWVWKRFHIAVAEKMIGRNILRSECVHHVDLNTLNNSVDNLCVMTIRNHNKCHASLSKCSAELYKRGFIGFDKKIGKYFIIE